MEFFWEPSPVTSSARDTVHFETGSQTESQELELPEVFTPENLQKTYGGNFFLVSNNRIRTPSTINCLDGISRQSIFTLGEKLNIPVEECQLLPYDVTTADEAFFTSTPYCIMPATKFNGLEIGDGKVGPITKQLIAAWSDLVGVDIIEQAQASKAS